MMPAGLPVALAMLAQATSAPAAAGPTTVYGPAAPVAVPLPKPLPLKTSERDCAAANADPNAKEIVVCAVRPQGYRPDPDVLEAWRQKKQGAGGRPHNPHESYADHSCSTVGPMGCRGGPTINLVNAANTLATMADRISKGEEIGTMFVTEPTPNEYQLYLQAKKRREAREADAAAKAKTAAAQAGAQTAPQPAPPPPAQLPALIQKQ